MADNSSCDSPPVLGRRVIAALMLMLACAAATAADGTTGAASAVAQPPGAGPAAAAQMGASVNRVVALVDGKEVAQATVYGSRIRVVVDEINAVLLEHLRNG